MSKEIDVIQTNEEKTWLETIADKIKKDKNTDDIDISFSTNYKNNKK